MRKDVIGHTICIVNVSPTSRPEWNDDALQIHLENGDLTMFSTEPPGSGAILAFIMNVLDGYNFNSTSLNPENEVLTHQRITEVFKYAYGLRTKIGDHNFVDVEDVSIRKQCVLF